jgi:hypothetical protein
MDNVEYTMHILFKFSNVALTGITVGSQPYPYYGNCEHYIYTKSATSGDYPRISSSAISYRVKYTVRNLHGYGYWRKQQLAVVFLHHRKAQFLLMELPRSCMMVK